MLDLNYLNLNNYIKSNDNYYQLQLHSGCIIGKTQYNVNEIELRHNINNIKLLSGKTLNNVTKISHIDHNKKVIAICFIDLSKFPIFKGKKNITQLTKLCLSGHQIQFIPEEIGNLTQLTELNLTKCKIKTIPKEIGNLTQLKKLDLAGNKIKTIPEEIGNLTQLEELLLYRNQIQIIPKEIGNLVQLKVLDLRRNQIQIIPKEMGKLIQLAYLDIYLIIRYNLSLKY
jgi:Leucine-rich repeat (LRR) protein